MERPEYRKSRRSAEEHLLSRRTRTSTGRQIGFPICLALAILVQGTPIVAQELPNAPGIAIEAQKTDEQNATKPMNHEDPNLSRPPLVTDHLPLQSVGAKFKLATINSLNYPAFLSTGLVAGFNQSIDAVPEFGQGGLGYSRYYWHSFADQVVGNYTVGFILPTVLHEDTRYYRWKDGSVGKRTGYALSRILRTRTDDGDPTWNKSEIVGSVITAGLSVLYYPSSQRTLDNVAQRFGTNLAGDAFVMLLKEFSPEVNRTLGNVVHFRLKRRTTNQNSTGLGPKKVGGQGERQIDGKKEID